MPQSPIGKEWSEDIYSRSLTPQGRLNYHILPPWAVPRLSQKGKRLAHRISSLPGMKAGPSLPSSAICATDCPCCFPPVSVGGAQGESSLSFEPKCHLSLLWDFASYKHSSMSANPPSALIYELVAEDLVGDKLSQ